MKNDLDNPKVDITAIIKVTKDADRTYMFNGLNTTYIKI